MDLVIFCDVSDRVMLSLYQSMMSKGYSSVVITGTDLAFAKNIVHSCNYLGKFETSIELHDGTIVDFSEVKCVINRLEFIPMVQFQNSTDRQYAELEMYALFISMLHSFSDILLYPFLPHHISSIEHCNKFLLHKILQDVDLPISNIIWTNDGNPYYDLSKKHFIPYELKLLFTEWKRKRNQFELGVKKPTLYMENVIHKSYVEVVGGIIVGNTKELKIYHSQIRELANILCFPIIKINYGYIDQTIKFTSVEVKASNSSDDALKILELQIIEKMQHYDNYCRDSKRITDSVSH